MTTMSPASSRKPSAAFDNAGAASNGFADSSYAGRANSTTSFLSAPSNNKNVNGNVNGMSTRQSSAWSNPNSPVAVSSDVTDPVQRLVEYHAKEMAAIRAAHSEEMSLLREQNTALQQGLTGLIEHMKAEAKVLQLQKRYASILTAPAGSFRPDLVVLWKGLGGQEKWKSNITSSDLTALLSTDTREEVLCKDTSLPAGFFEVVLSRLPCLKRCSLNGTRYFFDLSAMSTVSKPFSKLVHLELQNTNCTDYDVSELSQRLPALRTFYVNGCVRVTWEGLEQTRRASTTGITLLPANPNAKDLQDNSAMEKLWLDFTSAESAAEYRRLNEQYGQYLEGGSDPSGLVGLWSHKESIKPAQLTLLLSRQKRTTFEVTCPAEDAGSAQEQALRAELRRFCTYILPRLPKLERVDIYDAPEFPFNLTVLPQPIAFPSLTHVAIRRTPCSVTQLRELLKRVPSLRAASATTPTAVEVDLDQLENDTQNPALVSGILDNKVMAYSMDKFGHPTQKKIL